MRTSRNALFTIAALMIAVSTHPFPAHAQEKLSPLPAASEDPKATELRKLLQSYYEQMDEASGRLNMADSIKYIAPDCKVILRDGSKVTLKSLKDSLQTIYNRATKVQTKTEINVFSTKGDTATVETRTVQTMRLRGDNGIESDVEATGASRDFWMKTKTGWRIKQTRESDRTIKVNGQIIQE